MIEFDMKKFKFKFIETKYGYRLSWQMFVFFVMLFAGLSATFAQTAGLVILNDSATVSPGVSQTIDVLSNDNTTSCLSNLGVVVIKPAAHGSTTVLPDNKITYLATDDKWYGVDSLKYKVSCNGYSGNTSDSATVYIAVVRPYANLYQACPGSQVTVEMTQITNMTYRWYASESGGISLGTGNSFTLTMGATNSTVWAEPYYNENGVARIFPRYPVTVYLNPNCGTGTGCLTSGRLLFKEDFGSTTESSYVVCGNALPNGVTTYTFGDASQNGNYAICAYNNALANYWYTAERTFDHTIKYFDGYSMIINADYTPGKFYSLNIDNLCSDTRLYFSSWVFNLVNPKASAFTAGGQNINDFADPDLVFEVKDAVSGVILASYATGEIPKVDMSIGQPNWRQYGFEFTTGNSGSVILSIYNNAPGGNGNDLMLDDIEVFLCVPPVTITAPTEKETIVCGGDSITLAGIYTDDGTFGNNLVYRWIRSSTGNINNPSEWITVNEGTSSNPLNISYKISDMTSVNEGYYRLEVGTVSNIDQYNCVAMSNPIRLIYKPSVTASNIDVTGPTSICYNTSTSLTASLTGITLTNPIYKWYDSPTATVPVFTGQTYQTPQLTNTTSYYVGVAGDNYCETAAKNRDTVTITVSPAPSVNDITNVTNATICGGNTAILNATPASGYIPCWYSNAGLTDFLFEGDSFTTPVLNTTTTYYVVAKNIASGCIGDNITAKQTVVTVTSKPVVDFGFFADNSDPFTIMFFDSSTVNQGNITAWYWDFGDNTSSTVQNPVHQYGPPETDHEVKLIVTSNGGCTDSVSYSIHAGKTPFAKFSVNAAAQCLEGNLFEFTNLSTVNMGLQIDYLWTFGDGSDPSTLEDPVHHYTNTGTYTVKLVVTMGTSSDSTTIEVTVYPSPAITDFITVNNPTICAGNVAEFFASANSGFVPLWYSDSDLTIFLAEGNTYISPVLDTTTIYYVVLKSIATGCIGGPTAAKAATATINPLPGGDDITVTGASVCAGNTVTLRAIPASGFIACWYADAALTTFLFEGNNYTTPVLSATTTYYVVAKNIVTGCVGSPEVAKAVIATVNPLPVASNITSVNGAVICAGNTATLTAVTEPGFIPRWYADAALTVFLSEGNNYTTLVLTTDITYYVVAKNTVTGCSGDITAARPVLVFVHPGPSVDPVADRIYCAGEQVPAYTFTGNTTGAQYAWNFVSGDNIEGLPKSGYNQMPAFLAINDGKTELTAIYEVIPSYTDDLNITCTGTADTFAVSIQATASVTVAGSAKACNTSTTAVLSCINNNPLMPVYYKITFSDKALAAGFINMTDYALLTGNTISITVPEGVDPSQYPATLSLRNDCSTIINTYNFIVDVAPATHITQQPQSQYTICGENASIRLEVKAEGENLTYQWYKDSLAISGATSSIYEKANVGSADYGVYIVEVQGSCDSVMSNPSVVGANDISILVKWDDVLFVSRRDDSGNILAMKSFQWYRVADDGSMSPITNKGQSQYYAEKGLSGTFAVEVTYSDGTKTLSCPYTLIPVQPVSIKVYPNPAKPGEIINILLDLPDETIKNAVIEVYNGTGKLIERKQATGSITKFHLNVSAGVYIFRIIEPGGNITAKKIVIE